MMWHGGLRTLLAVLGLTGAGAAVMAFRIPLEAPVARQTSLTRPGTASSTGSPDRPDSLVVARNMFRPDRRPAPIRYDPARADDGPPPAGEPRPLLSLAGVVLGRTRAALVRGIPGTEGVHVLAEGEDLGGVRVVRVMDTAAVVTWRSDTLHLALVGGGS